MMRAARIEHGLVADLWEVPALDCYGDEYTLVAAPEGCGIGWVYTDTGGLEPPPIQIDEARATAIARVKADAGHVIMNRYPDWKQRNLTARAVELLANGAASGPEWEALSAAWAWISAVRQESDRVEMAILAADTQIDIDAALATATWPA